MPTVKKTIAFVIETEDEAWCGQYCVHAGDNNLCRFNHGPRAFDDAKMRFVRVPRCHNAERYFAALLEIISGEAY